MENLPALATNSTEPGCTDRVTRSASDTAVCRVHRAQAAAHAIRDLQDRAPTRIDARRPPDRPAGEPSHLPAHGRLSLLEAGVEVNVIREWLGQHVNLTTTNRYTQTNTKTKMAALRASEPAGDALGPRTLPDSRSDESLLNRLTSL